MSIGKDTNGTWRVRIRYTDQLGKRRETQKRGFKTKKEALIYEREFFLKMSSDINMSFESLSELYFQDVEMRLKKNTLSTKKFIVGQRIAPFFNHMKLVDITPSIIRKWQSHLLGMTSEHTGKKFTPTYIRTIYTQLVAIFNYAVKFHNLKENPCHKAGTVGKKYGEEMNIWTIEEFQKFITCPKLINETTKIGFLVLFWTGMRIGELLALTKEDINFEKKTITINKSYQRIKGQDIITTPKTSKSKRVINIDDNLILTLKTYIKKFYQLENNDRIFPRTRSIYEYEIKRISEAVNLKRIRVHDLRHSHASLLIHLGVNVVAISKRLGHENVQTTLNVYSHLYPNTNSDMMELLKDISNKKAGI